MKTFMLVSLFLGVVFLYTNADAKSYFSIKTDSEEIREKRSTKRGKVFLVAKSGSKKNKRWVNCTLPCLEEIDETIENPVQHCLDDWLALSLKHFQLCWICRTIFNCGEKDIGETVFGG